VAKFRYSLESVLHLKRQLEGQAKNDLAREIVRYNLENSVLEGYLAAIDGAMDAFRAQSGGVFTAGGIQRLNHYLERMRDLEEAQRGRVREAELAVEEARAKLVEAMREREMFDKLREKRYAQYLQEERRAEQRAVDERISYVTSLADRAGVAGGRGIHGEEGKGE